MRHTRSTPLASGLAILGAAALCASTAFAAPASKMSGSKMSGSSSKMMGKKSMGKSSKVVDVPFCVMDQMAMHKGMGATQVVGKNRLYFCSATERKQFNALPSAQRQKKIAAVLKLQQSKGKSNGKMPMPKGM